MSNDLSDLSDEAAEEYFNTPGKMWFGMDVWRECRRRAEAMLEERLKEYNELCDRYDKLDLEIEDRERKAFAAAYKFVDPDIGKMQTVDEACRAYQAEGRK